MNNFVKTHWNSYLEKAAAEAVLGGTVEPVAGAVDANGEQLFVAVLYGEGGAKHQSTYARTRAGAQHDLDETMLAIDAFLSL